MPPRQPRTAECTGRLFAAAAVAAVVILFGEARREECIDREADLFEQLTGIIGGGNAFFIRDAVVIRRDQHLHLTLQLNDGEQTKSNGDTLTRRTYKAAVIPAGDALGNRRIITAVGAITQLAAQRNGVYGLDNSPGHVGVLTLTGYKIIGTENTHISFTAVQNYFLCKAGNAVNGDRLCTAMCIDTQTDVKEECHIHRVEAAVEGDRFYFQKYLGDSCFTNFQIDRLIDILLCLIGENDRKILQTILIAAGIVDTADVYTNGFPEVLAVIGRAAGSVCTVSGKERSGSVKVICRVYHFRLWHENPPDC